MEKFTKEEMAVLSQHEENFNRAMEADYYRNISDRDLTAIHAIYESKLGSYHLNKACGACVLAFLKSLASAYFMQKA